MLTKIFSAIHVIGASASTRAASLCRDYSFAICDRENHETLRRTYIQAEYIKAQVKNLKLAHQDKLNFMTELAEFIELAGTPRSFSELIGYFEGSEIIFAENASERTEFAHSFGLFKAAQSFNDHFVQLPQAVQKAVDWALAPHKRVIKKLVEAEIDRLERDSEQFTL